MPDIRGKVFGGAIVAVAAAGLSLVGAPIHAESRGDAQQAFAKAQAFQAEGDLRSARIELMNAIQADPSWAQARLAQARVFLGLGDALGAEAELDRARELGAAMTDIRAPMGESLLLQGKPRKALEMLTSGPFAVRDEAYGFRTIARAEMVMGNRQAAGQAFDRALAADDRDSTLWVDIARYRFTGGEQGGAVGAVDHALKLEPSNVRALQFRGELVREQFGLVPALPWFEQALKIAPNDVMLLTEYAATLGDMGEMRKMLAVTRQILNVDAENPRAFYMQAVLAARAGHFNLARKLMYKTRGQLDQTPAAMLVNGILDYEAGNWNAAVDIFSKLNRLQPDNRKVELLLARALERSGAREDMLEKAERLAGQSNASPYLLTVVGRAFEILGDGQRAAEYLQKAAQPFAAPMLPIANDDTPQRIAASAKAAPGNARAVIPYLRNLLAEGDLEAARQWAKPLFEANPGASDAHIMMGDIALSGGDPAKALLYYQSASRIRLGETELVRMVVALRQMDRIRQSGELITWYLNQNPSNLTASRMLAMAYMDAGNWPYAVKLLREISTRLGSNDALLMADLALAELRNGDTERARNAARIAYRVQPANPVATHVLGLVSLESGKGNRAALELLQKAHALEPENAYFTYNLARAYLANGMKGPARKTLQLALAGGPFADRDRAEKLAARL